MADTVFQVPFFVGDAILFSIVFFAAEDDSWHSTRQCERLRQGKIFLSKNSWHKMKRAGEVSRAEGKSFTVLKRIGQGVLFPKDVIVDAQFAHQLEDFIKGSKEDMQPTFNPITFAVFLGKTPTTENVT